jgi:hypothetical protein
LRAKVDASEKLVQKWGTSTAEHPGAAFLPQHQADSNGANNGSSPSVGGGDHFESSYQTIKQLASRVSINRTWFPNSDLASGLDCHKSSECGASSNIWTFQISGPEKSLEKEVTLPRSQFCWFRLGFPEG